MPKDKCSRHKLDDDESVLLLDKYECIVIIKHDLKILILVLNTNPVVKIF